MTTSNHLLQLLLLFSSALVHGSLTSTCNGVEGLCGFSVNDILYGNPHNAMSSPSHGFTIFYNHENDPIVASLDAGFRSISVDICRCNGQLVFCHGSSTVGCGIGSRNAVDTFQQLDDWLDSHPQDILIVFLEINNDAGGANGEADVSLQDVESTLSDSFKSKMYQHNPNQAWPTLGEMVQDCKQIILFYNRGPEGNPPNGNPNGIHFFYDFASQTLFSHQTVESLQAAPCDIFRSGTRQDFYLFNDFILTNGIAPSKTAAQTVNTGTFVEPILQQCEAAYGRPVNIVSVDFWKQGDLANFVATHNAGLVAKDSVKAQVTISTDACRPASPTDPSTGTPASSPSSAPADPQAPTDSPPSAPADPGSSASRTCSMRFVLASVPLLLLATL